MSEFQPIRTNIRNLLSGPDSVSRVGRMLHHWALWKSYQDLIKYVKDARVHTGLANEIARRPILLELFLKHLKEKAHLHIDVDNESIFNEDIIGDENEWEVWQENGYSLYRDGSNFPRRLQRWINYYNASRGTYEKTIDARNRGYETGDIIPYWKLWEVGVLAGAEGGYGYPSYTGLQYVEKAYMDLPKYMDQAMNYLEQYVVNAIDGNQILPAPFRTTQWLSVLRRSGVV